MSKQSSPGKDASNNGASGSSNPPILSRPLGSIRPENVATPTKGIGSQVVKQEDGNGRGQKMKMVFSPAVGLRRKKSEGEMKSEETAFPSTPDSSRGRGRGRGRGSEAGRGRGATPRVESEMSASGPFALGPAPSNRDGRRGGLARVGGFSSHHAATSIPSGLTSTGLKLKQETGRGMNLNGMKEEDLDVYSEPETDDRGVDRGVEIVDMDDIKSLDWMAPESLKKVKEEKVRVKKSTKDVKGKGKAKETDAVNDVDAEEKDAAKALDLSESEEDEPLDDVLEEFLHFQDDDGTTIQDKLYFFQFPTPFPTFLPLPTSEIMDVEMEPPNPSSSTSGPRKSVSFANGSRPGVPDEPPAPDEKPKVAPPIDGVIGQLEMYKSGAVKMRLGNGIVMDVTPATQPTFLQHAIHLDTAKKHITVLGEVNRRFVVSPDMNALLEELEEEEKRKVEGFGDAFGFGFGEGDGLVGMEMD